MKAIWFFLFLLAGAALVGLFSDRSSLPNVMPVPLLRKQEAGSVVRLPDPKQLGIVLQPGEPPPAPDPPFYGNTVRTPHKNRRAGPVEEKEPEKGAIKLSPEKLKELERKGAVAF